MATTNIELDIENITGVADADDQFIKTAQKWVVSSIPKELMIWAGTSTSPGTHGGDSSPTAITLPQPTDNIIDVSRNGYSAEEVPESMQGFIANSSSLHLATTIFPKYYMQAGNKIVVKPDPSDSATALVNYVDFLKVDDDCDLRGAVVFHASSKEFEKLASAQSSDIVTALTAVNAEIDECLTIADNIHTEIALINAQSDSALTEIALANTEIDKMAAEVTLSNAEVDKSTAEVALSNTEADKMAAEVSLANAEIDKAVTEIGLANAEVDEAATLVDSGIDTATAAIATAAGRVNTAVGLIVT